MKKQPPLLIKKEDLDGPLTMIEDLLKCLYSYKASMDYKGKNFDGDRVQ